MHVEFERSGGHLPVVFSASLDTQSLPAVEAAELKRLIDESGILQGGMGTSTRTAPDAYAYSISVTTDEGERRDVVLSELEVPGQLRPLLGWLSKRASAGGVR